MEKPPATTSTTFVQADAHTFTDLVQKLTGTNEDCPDKLPITVPSRMASHEVAQRPGFKLQEQRQTMRKLDIKLGLTSLRNAGFASLSPRSPSLHHHHHGASPPIASPVTPLVFDTFSIGFLGERGAVLQQVLT